MSPERARPSNTSIAQRQSCAGRIVQHLPGMLSFGSTSLSNLRLSSSAIEVSSPCIATLKSLSSWWRYVFLHKQDRAESLLWNSQPNKIPARRVPYKTSQLADRVVWRMKPGTEASTRKRMAAERNGKMENMEKWNMGKCKMKKKQKK